MGGSAREIRKGECGGLQRVGSLEEPVRGAGGLKTTETDRLKGIKLEPNDRLVLDGKVANDDLDSLRAIIQAGKGRVVWMSPQAQDKQFFPKQILNYCERNGEIVTMLVPESAVFKGIEIGDMAWMGGPSVERVPYSSRGGYHVAWKNPNLSVLSEEMKAHGNLETPTDKIKSWVTPLVSVQPQGAAPVLLSEMSVAALKDPIALRLWANLLSVQ